MADCTTPECEYVIPDNEEVATKRCENCQKLVMPKGDEAPSE